MLQIETTALVIIDVQPKLMNVIPDHEPIAGNLHRLTEAADYLGLATIITEQLPEKLGRTIKAVSVPIGCPIIAKSSFSCWGEPEFRTELTDQKPTTVVLAGIEAHVCVYQTALDLLAAGYQVQVIADAVGSRSPANRDLAFSRFAAEGIRMTNTEMLLFELLGDANHPEFKSILNLIK